MTVPHFYNSHDKNHKCNKKIRIDNHVSSTAGLMISHIHPQKAYGNQILSTYAAIRYLVFQNIQEQ